MPEVMTRAPTRSEGTDGAHDQRSRLDMVREELRDLDRVFTPFEGLAGDWGRGGALGRKRVEQEVGAHDDAFPVEELVGSSAVHIPMEQHVAFLEKTRPGSPGNGAHAVRVVNELQRRYGNGYVQRVIDRVQTGDVDNGQTGTIQRARRRKRGSLVEKRIRQHEKAIKEAGGTKRRTTAAPPKKEKAKPPAVPAKTYSHLRPGELVETGGQPGWFFAKTYRSIVDQAKKYRARKRKSPTDYKGQWAALGKLSKSIKSWRKKFWLLSRKARRQALAALEAQIRKERARLVPWVTKKHLILSAQLEKNDVPYHREGMILEYCYGRWTRETGKKWNPEEGPPPAEFYDYATMLEQVEDKKLLVRVRKIVHAKTGAKGAEEWIASRKREGRKDFIPRITYVPEEERKKYKVRFSGADVFYTETGKKLEPQEDYIYVMAPSGEFYVARETKKTQLRFHHSSFLGGQPVAAAGALKQTRSGLLQIDLESGHYQPDIQHMYNALKALEDKGASLDKLKVQPFYEVKGLQVSGATFLEGVQGLKAGESIKGGKVAMLLKRYIQAEVGVNAAPTKKQRKGYLKELKDKVAGIRT